ncbi:MAG: alginate lyase family protein [Terracidiphilus sp.]
MQPAEMLWRATQMATLPLDFIGMLRAGKQDRYEPGGAWWKRAEYPIVHHRNGGEYGTTRIFDLEFPPEFAFDWHRDYQNGKTVRQSFCRRIDIRNPDIVGDIKYIWEINRHQHLSAIAFSNRPDAERVVSQSLRNWIDNNPFFVGVNWTSSLELALRLISWALIFPIVSSRIEREPEFRKAFAASVYLHLRAIRSHLSLYSSANNHLIGELVGLYIGAVCFPWWKECGQWRIFAQEMLETEVQLQFTLEGVNREQAISYQFFTLELLLLALLVGRNGGCSFSDAFCDRIRAALEYLASLATPAGDLPWFGDSDDARGFVVSSNETAFEVVMQLGAGFFHEPRFARRVPRITAAARALMPNEFPRLVKSAGIAEPLSDSLLLQDGGILMIRSGNWKLVMDVGPLGYSSIAAHGHADALSLTLAAGDRYILIDPGTYAYHSHPEWRAYFRGTAAHNTARVDGCDQSMQAGRFLWTSKAKTSIAEFRESGDMVCVVAEHDGYLRLADPVLHRRAVVFDRKQAVILVEDSFVCKAAHDIEIHWHLSERVDVKQLSDGSLLGIVDDSVIAFSFSGQPCGVNIVRGATSPILGWRSPSFNRKNPIPTIRCALRATGTTRILTRIALNH